MNYPYSYEYIPSFGGPRHDFIPRDFHFTQPYYHNYGQSYVPPFAYGMPHPNFRPHQPFWPHYMPHPSVNHSPPQPHSAINESNIKTEVKL